MVPFCGNVREGEAEAAQTDARLCLPRMPCSEIFFCVQVSARIGAETTPNRRASILNSSWMGAAHGLD